MKLITSHHSRKRAFERLIESNEPLGELEHQFMDKLLLESIIPFRGGMVEGSKYYAQIDGYPNHRAVIVVQDNTHIIKTVIPTF